MAIPTVQYKYQVTVYSESDNQVAIPTVQYKYQVTVYYDNKITR